MLNRYGNRVLVVSAFPGVGKSFFAGVSGYKVLDFESSQYSYLSNGSRNPSFPVNYIEFMKAQLDSFDMVLISSHAEVRRALYFQEIPFTLVYPHSSLKQEYLERYRLRGSDQNFINLVDSKWYEWLADCAEQHGCIHRVLQAGQYLSDLYKEGV